MSGIPPDIAGSALQAGYVQRAASRDADAARTGQAQATERQLRATDEAAGNVETTDDDAQIYSDAEGTGGQGRVFGEESEQENEDTDAEGAEEHSGSLEDTDSPPRLDIQA